LQLKLQVAGETSEPEMFTDLVGSKVGGMNEKICNLFSARTQRLQRNAGQPFTTTQ